MDFSFLQLSDIERYKKSRKDAYVKDNALFLILFTSKANNEMLIGNKK